MHAHPGGTNFCVEHFWRSVERILHGTDGAIQKLALKFYSDKKVVDVRVRYFLINYYG